MTMRVPIITIDGPSASGKGTVAMLVARQLGFHYLDSGSLYRLVALFASIHHIRFDDEPALVAAARNINATFDGIKILLEGKDVSDAIRAECVGEGASRLAALPAVRAALLARQHAFCQMPGLVTDGRDMGSVVFPEAILKVFLTAKPEVRAERRYRQLREKGESATISKIKQDIIERDARDRARQAAPLRCGPDALVLDTSAMTVDQAVAQIVMWFERKKTFSS